VIQEQRVGITLGYDELESEPPRVKTPEKTGASPKG
jgi:hypothetical protein